MKFIANLADIGYGWGMFSKRGLPRAFARVPPTGDASADAGALRRPVACRCRRGDWGCALQSLRGMSQGPNEAKICQFFHRPSRLEWSQEACYCLWGSFPTSEGGLTFFFVKNDSLFGWDPPPHRDGVRRKCFSGNLLKIGRKNGLKFVFYGRFCCLGIILDKKVRQAQSNFLPWVFAHFEINFLGVSARSMVLPEDVTSVSSDSRVFLHHHPTCGKPIGGLDGFFFLNCHFFENSYCSFLVCIYVATATTPRQKSRAFRSANSSVYAPMRASAWFALRKKNIVPVLKVGNGQSLKMKRESERHKKSDHCENFGPMD